MQTVLMFAAKAGTALMAGGHAAAGAASAAGGAAAGGSKLLSMLRVGTSAVSALSSFGQARQEAFAQRLEAGDEDMAARQEFIQATETASAIQRQFNRTVSDQLAVASASGIDLGSGSVVEARNDARTDAERQIGIVRNGAATNAAVRRGRASYLRGAAKATTEGGLLGGAVKLGLGLLDAQKVGS